MLGGFNVGCFSMDLGGAGGTITYLEGELGQGVMTVHVGGAVIPEPGTTGLTALAIGAIALRRRRATAA